MDSEVLQSVGLTAGESRVYLSLLKLGETTTGPIVDDSGVARSKVYHVLWRLMNKGLVSSIIKSKMRYFRPLNPHKIRGYLDSKEQEIQRNKRQLEQILPGLATLQKMAVCEEAEIYKGIEGVKSARELVFHILKKGDTFFCFGANKANQKPLQAYWRDFHSRRRRQGIKAKYIIQEDSRATIGKEKEASGLINVRYLDVTGPVHIDMFGDYIVICIIKGSYTSFLLKNSFAAAYFKSYFENAFRQAKS